uniref:Uncharacterized protein n=1 Tax=Ascaris lumbricoides TaxID=6252 RepID=A0A9J2PJ58_ASCLU
MARPTAAENRFFWELIVAFTIVVCAAVFQTFHFFNNAWLTQSDGSIEYQRGLGDDCVKSDDFGDEGIRCSEWGAPSTFILNGNGVSPEDVADPPAGLKFARVLMIINVFLYLIVIFALFIVCVKKQDLNVQRVLCAVSLLLILLNVIVIFLIIVVSFFPFIRNKGKCSVGSAYYFFLLSNVLLWIASVSHFDTWRDVYLSLKPVHFPTHSEMHDMDERRPSFLHI